MFVTDNSVFNNVLDQSLYLLGTFPTRNTIAVANLYPTNIFTNPSIFIKCNIKQPADYLVLNPTTGVPEQLYTIADSCPFPHKRNNVYPIFI